jgi:hypothetical protein
MDETLNLLLRFIVLFTVLIVGLSCMFLPMYTHQYQIVSINAVHNLNDGTEILVNTTNGVVYFAGSDCTNLYKVGSVMTVQYTMIGLPSYPATVGSWGIWNAPDCGAIGISNA